MDSRYTHIYSLGPADFPGLLMEMQKPPKELRIRGTIPPPASVGATMAHTYITVVGSRKYSDYGKRACEELIGGLADLPVIIVSGLAFGIDSIAHRAALDAGLMTIAVPGSGLNDSVLYPATHIGLAHEILRRGGALISPFSDDTAAAPWTFPERNAVMAGMSHATLVIEAEEKSGTLITARNAAELNRDVLAVPGSIFSPQSAGPHGLMRDGAIPVTSSADVREALGFPRETPSDKGREPDLSPEELRLINLISLKTCSKDDLFETFGGDIGAFNALISALEIKGKINVFLGSITLRK